MAESTIREQSSWLFETLSKIINNQEQLFKEFSLIKQNLLELHEKNKMEATSVEIKMLGLSTVLDRVQERLVQLETTQYNSSRDSSSTSSLSSTDQDISAKTADLQYNQAEQNCTHGGSQPHNHRKWLKDNHLSLVKGIDPTKCSLLDYLIEDDVLSLTDEEEIKFHRTRKEKTRELLFKMRHADNEKICKFVKHLQKDFPHLVPSFCNDSEMGEVNSCVACDVVEQVNVDDVIDVLLQEAVIDEDLYEKIWRCSIKKRGWNRLLKNMNHAQMSKCLSVLAKALVLKYPQICKRITKSGIKTLKCCCYNNRCSKARNRKFSKLKSQNDKPASGIGFTELYKKVQIPRIIHSQFSSQAEQKNAPGVVQGGPKVVVQLPLAGPSASPLPAAPSSPAEKCHKISVKLPISPPTLQPPTPIPGTTPPREQLAELVAQKRKVNSTLAQILAKIIKSRLVVSQKTPPPPSSSTIMQIPNLVHLLSRP